MKILILANNDLGLYNFRKELIEKLLECNHKVIISLPNGKRVNDLVHIGCDFIDTNVDRRGINPIKDMKLILKYNRIMKTVKPDIVLTYTIKPNIYGGITSRYNKIPYIVNITGLGTALENKGIIQRILILLYRIALKKVKCCFVQNEENLKFLIKNKITNKEKSKLIPGSGVNLLQYKLLEYPNDRMIRFLFIGRVMKEKGIDLYIETAKYITNKYKNIEFNILGECEQNYEILLKKLQDDKVINYYGRQDNIIPFLEKTACLIHPSYYPEGMSNVLLEASASGRPVITTNRSGCREVVEDEKTGFIIETKSINQLLNRVERFLKMPNEQRKKMGVAARKKVEEQFDRNIIVNEYLAEIGEIND